MFLFPIIHLLEFLIQCLNKIIFEQLQVLPLFLVLPFLLLLFLISLYYLPFFYLFFFVFLILFFLQYCLNFKKMCFLVLQAFVLHVTFPIHHLFLFLIFSVLLLLFLMFVWLFNWFGGYNTRGIWTNLEFDTIFCL